MGQSPTNPLLLSLFNRIFLSIPISTAAIDPNTTTSQERAQRTAARRVAPTHATAGLLLEPAWTECCGKLLREIDAQVSRGVLLPPPYVSSSLSISSLTLVARILFLDLDVRMSIPWPLGVELITSKAACSIVLLDLVSSTIAEHRLLIYTHLGVTAPVLIPQEQTLS
jgi:hypothetical protein